MITLDPNAIATVAQEPGEKFKEAQKLVFEVYSFLSLVD